MAAAPTASVVDVPPATSLAALAAQFDRLPDPRSPIHLVHPLSSVLVIAILAILAGSNGPTAIARWAEIKQELLVRGLALWRAACRARMSSAWC